MQIGEDLNEFSPNDSGICSVL